MAADELLERLVASGRRERVPTVKTVANPAAGANFTIGVTGGGVWQPLSLRAIFTTSAVVAAREPELTIDDGTTVFAHIVTGTTQTASATVRRSWVRGPTTNVVSPNGGWIMQPMAALALPLGFRFVTVVDLIDAGDQWSAIALYVVDFVEYPPMYEQARELAELARTRQTPGFPEWEAT